MYVYTNICILYIYLFIYTKVTHNQFCWFCRYYKNLLKTHSEKLFSTTILHLSQEPNKKKSRKRKIIWFNPPYFLCVKKNVWRKFLKLIKKHFPKGNSLNEIFNKNTMKVSCNCMGNISFIISLHNKNILNPVTNTEYVSNCRSRESCSLQNKCLTRKIMY